MANDKKVVYQTASDVSVVKLVEAAKGGVAGQRKMRNNEGKCWTQTVLWLHGLCPLDSFDDTQEIKAIAEDVRDAFKSNFLIERDSEIGEIDEETEGRNARTGENVKVLDAKGEPKWSSWEETKTPIGYCGDLARVIKAGKVSDLIPKANRVMGRSDILKQCKAPETPLETIMRSLDMADKKFEECSDADKLKALDAITDLFDKLDKASPDASEVELDKAA